MRTRTFVALVVVAVVLSMIFAFAPVVNTTTRPVDQLAFLGPLPTSESMSCALLGVGAGYWPTAPAGGPSLTWTYQFGCPPKP